MFQGKSVSYKTVWNVLRFWIVGFYFEALYQVSKNALETNNKPASE